jgi:hypothetical protein
MALGSPGLPAITGPTFGSVPNLPAIAGPSEIIDASMSTSVIPSTDMGSAPMSPMESVIAIFEEIRDGINQLVELAIGEEKDRDLKGRNAAIASGDTDTPPPGTKPQDSGSMLDSLKDALSGLGDTGMGLLGITALITGFLIFNSLADSLAKGLEPILEFLGETLIPNIKELNDIILSHPGGYFTLLGAVGLVTTLDEVFGFRGSLNKLFISISNFARTAFIDDIDFRTKIGKTWAGRINRAIYGTKSGKGGLINNITKFIRGIGASIRSSFNFTSASKALTTSAGTWQATINAGIMGSKGGPGGAGGKLGIIGRLGQIFSSIGQSIRGIFTSATATRGLDAVKDITKAFGRTMARIGRTVTNTLGFIGKISGLTQFLKLGLGFAKAIPIIGQIIMVVQGLFGFVTGAIEGYKTGGILGAITGALTGLYDALIGQFLNLIFDILGWIFKKLGLEGLGNFFSNLDFTFDGIKDVVLNVIDGIRFVFHKVTSGLKRMYNGIIKGINFISKYVGIELEPFELTPFVPMKRPEEPEPIEEPAPEVREVPDVEAMRADIKPVDTEALTMPDLGAGITTPNAPVFAPVTQTGGDTFNTSASVSVPLSSSHTDETARILSVSVYN